MDAISLIIAALIAGAEKTAGKTVENAATDAYNGLKALIKRKFAGDKKAEMILEEHETDPETYEAPLKKKLAEAEVDKDEAIIKLAQELLKQLKPQDSPTSGKFKVEFQGEVKCIQVGDRNRQKNTFSS